MPCKSECSRRKLQNLLLVLRLSGSPTQSERTCVDGGAVKKKTRFYPTAYAHSGSVSMELQFPMYFTVFRITDGSCTCVTMQRSPK